MGLWGGRRAVRVRLVRHWGGGGLLEGREACLSYVVAVDFVVLYPWGGGGS